MQIIKSKGHAKISMDFGRMLLRYWLSKSGFEVSDIHHPDIHLIVRNPNMGISVWCRTRKEGTEDDHINVFADRIDKFSDACNAKDYVPYFAFVVDSSTIMRVFIISKNHFEVLCPPGEKGDFCWKMGERDLSKYGDDEDIKTFQLKTEKIRWWGTK